MILPNHFVSGPLCMWKVIMKQILDPHLLLTSKVNKIHFEITIEIKDYHEYISEICPPLHSPFAASRLRTSKCILLNSFVRGI